MAKVACKIKTYDDEYDADFDSSFIERVKAAGRISTQKQNFMIRFSYRDEDGHHEVKEPLQITSWDDVDKIACTVLTYIYLQHGGFEYSTLDELVITGQGKVMSFNEKALMRITEDMKADEKARKEEERERKELARLQEKYKKSC